MTALFSLSLEQILTDNNKSFGIHWDKIVKKKKNVLFFGVFVPFSCYQTAENNLFFYCTKVLYQQLYQFFFDGKRSKVSAIQKEKLSRSHSV